LSRPQGHSAAGRVSLVIRKETEGRKEKERSDSAGKNGLGKEQKKKKKKEEERKGSLDSLKSRQRKTTISVWFVVCSVRLVMTGFSVRSVSCGHILLAQDTTHFFTYALIVKMTRIKCCILPRILLQLAPTAGQFATVTLCSL
jgi:hypothetical protein